MPELDKAAFLDRDGVINRDVGYVHRIKDFEFIDGVFHACRRLRELGYKLIVATNQSGIGRGYFTESDYQKVNNWMLECFEKEGAPVTAVYHCPYHPDSGLGEYQRESPYRKPGPQMLLDAGAEHKLDLQKSFLVGDKIGDLEAARAAGIPRSYFIGDAAELPDAYSGIPVYPSLYALVQGEYGMFQRGSE
jgi:D-glycero-D-manno-heptose 1,7-bisphosphate phosphatase